MSAGLLLITHAGIGTALLQSVATMLDMDISGIGNLEIEFDADTEQAQRLAEQQVLALDQGEGVLILTDIHGATPSNIACRLLPSHPVRIVSGLNLPMLLRVLNYPESDLDSLTHTALEGGTRHVSEATAQSCEQDND